MSDDDLNQGGPSFNGPDAAKAAAAEIVERRAQTGTGNKHADSYIFGHGDYPPVEYKVSKEAAKRAASENANSPGLDVRKAASELAASKRATRAAMNAELAGLGTPVRIAPGSDEQAFEAEQEQSEQSETQPRGEANSAAEHPEVVTAKQQAQAAIAQAQHQAAMAQAEAIHAALVNEVGREFADIYTYEQGEQLRHTDPPRYQRWLAANNQYNALLQGMAQQHAQHQAQHEQHVQQWSAAQDAAFSQWAGPALADPSAKAAAAQDAMHTLEGLGFSREELTPHWNSGQLRDARVQALVWKASQYDKAISTGRRAAAKPVPSVQRPGTRRPAGADAEEAAQSGMAALEKSGSLRDAARTLLARRAARE